MSSSSSLPRIPNKNDPNDSSQPLMKSDGEVELIGHQCDVQSCRQLDFLPFKCGSCEGTYCLDHRSEISHACPKEGFWAQRRRQASISKPSTNPAQNPGRVLGNGMSESICTAPSCKTKINTPKMLGVTCSECHQQFCLPHRLPAQHDCQPRPVYQYAGGASTQDKAKSAMAKFRGWASSAGKNVHVPSVNIGSIGSSSSTRRAASTVAQQFANVTALKKTAKGDDKVALDKRVYLHVEAEAKSTSAKQPKGDYYYSKDWSVGRVMDIAAKGLQIPNLNNQTPSDENRLRVFHIEGGRLLSFGEKIGDSVTNGNTIVLLRGLQLTDMIGDEV